MVSVKFKILLSRKSPTVTTGMLLNPVFIAFVTSSMRSLSLHRLYSVLLLSLLVLLAFISNILLGGITILSKPLITESVWGPQRFQCFGKYLLIKLYEMITIKSPLLFRFEQVKKKHQAHANFPWILVLWVHTLYMQKECWWNGNIYLYLKVNRLGICGWRHQLAGGCLICGKSRPFMKFYYLHY